MGSDVCFMLALRLAVEEGRACFARVVLFFAKFLLKVNVILSIHPEI